MGTRLAPVDSTEAAPGRWLVTDTTHVTHDGRIEMNNDKDLTQRGAENDLKGKAREAKGVVRDNVGQVTGNESQELKGKGERLAGKAQQNVGKAERNLDKNV